MCKGTHKNTLCVPLLCVVNVLLLLVTFLQALLPLLPLLLQAVLVISAPFLFYNSPLAPPCTPLLPFFYTVCTLPVIKTYICSFSAHCSIFLQEKRRNGKNRSRKIENKAEFARPAAAAAAGGEAVCARLIFFHTVCSCL